MHTFCDFAEEVIRSFVSENEGRLELEADAGA